MDDREKALRRIVDSYYDFRAVMHELSGAEGYGDTLLCPFHPDSRKSAKIYRDADGDRLYCFTEVRQYRVSDYLLKMGEKLEKWVPEGYEPPPEPERKVFDYSPLDGFKKGIMTIGQFCEGMLNLKVKL